MENGLDKGEDARMSTINVETRIVHFLWIIHLQSENSREKEGWKCLEASAWRVLNIQLFGGLGEPRRVSGQVNDLVSCAAASSSLLSSPSPSLHLPALTFLVGGIVVTMDHNIY